MGKLFPGLGVWFCEPQRDGSQKDVPAVILWAEDGVAFVIVARGTSQIHDRAGFAGDGALSFGPHDIVGKSVETLALSIRADTITTLAKPRRQADESSNER